MKETDFTNELVASSDLPQYETVSIIPIDPSYWYVILANVVLAMVVVGGGAAVLLFMALDSSILAWSVLGGWLLFMSLQLVVRRLAFKQRGYAVREHDVIYRRGVLSTETTIVPFNRIQHVSINEGLFSRRLGLAQLQVFTAGGTAANMSISGLPKEEAERIKTYILRNIHQVGGLMADISPIEDSDG